MVITENQDQVKRQPSGEYVRMVDINANSTEIANGIATADYCAGSSLLNSETGEVYLLTEYNDGTKAWNKIGGGGGGTYQVKTATVNGDVTPDTGYDALSKVTVAVPNGTEVGNFTANGTYNPTSPNIGFSSVVVNVSGGGGGGEELVKRTATSYSNNTITSVGSYAFYNYSNLTSVTLPAVTTVGESSFNGSGITTIALPACTTVGDSAFNNCSNLASVSFPELLTVSDSAFSSCSALTTITLAKCTTIGSGAFNGCSNMTTFSAPLCTAVGYLGFSGCSSLNSVNIPECVSCGDSTFQGDSSLVTLSLPKCQTLGASCFYGCENLTTITFGAITMTQIPSELFDGCSALPSIPTDIANCTSMDGSNTFHECSSLTNAALPNCTNVCSYAFDSCTALITVTIPNCTEISSSAFSGCDAMTNLYLSSVVSVTSVESDAFGETAHTTPINVHVPSALLSDFQADTNWAYLAAQGFVTIVAA